ncbi:hypothetical protein K491DRAFT_677640 [Lophiostoma macrostomum CBS 122681]|uniref:Uncharacterized protein n=1 Tax=Lophiostoma macrostomum CBS 122681 TaxID=1314788 RepID=A0A6A6TAL5_9PLEO|nr:hypothetical protein K491DRAFT_677640 [Lophiostoma macrostomum CBS 122681]
MHEDETSVLRVLLDRGPAETAREHSSKKYLAPIPDKFRRPALLSHFCFRVMFWNNEQVTPPDLRAQLAAVESPDAVAEFLNRELKALKAEPPKPENNDAGDPWTYMNPPSFCKNRLDYHVYNDVDALIWHMVVELDEGWQGPGFLQQAETYVKFSNDLACFKGQDLSTYTETSVIWQLQKHLHEYYKEYSKVLELGTREWDEGEKEMADLCLRLWQRLYDAQWLWAYEKKIMAREKELKAQEQEQKA